MRAYINPATLDISVVGLWLVFIFSIILFLFFIFFFSITMEFMLK